MNISNRCATSVLTVTIALNISSGLSGPIPEGQLDQRIQLRLDDRPSVTTTLRELLKIEDYSVTAPQAFRFHSWLRATYPEFLVPPPVSDAGIAAWDHDRPLRSVAEFERGQGYSFCDAYYLTFTPSTRVPQSLLFSVPQNYVGTTPLQRERFVELMRELAELAGVRLPGYAYVEMVTFLPGRTDVSVSYEACLPGTRLRLGPGLSGIMDKFTGLPVHIGFSREIPPFETPFRPLMSREEGYAWAVAAVYDRVPWSSYRVFVQAPYLEVPEYGEVTVTRSPRHQVLINEKRRCVVTTAIIRPIVEPGTISESLIVSIDSQTREILAIGPGPGPENFGGAKAGVPLKNQLNVTQMIGLLDGSLKIPVVLAKGERRPEGGLVKVVFRQGPISFAAELDANRHVLWHEGRAYKGTRAFTAGLLKAFSK